jgi:hypothetical protein
MISIELPFREKPGTYPKSRGPRYTNFANLKDVKAVFHMFAFAMVAPAKAAMHTGGVILESWDSQ